MNYMHGSSLNVGWSVACTWPGRTPLLSRQLSVSGKFSDIPLICFYYKTCLTFNSKCYSNIFSIYRLILSDLWATCNVVSWILGEQRARWWFSAGQILAGEPNILGDPHLSDEPDFLGEPGTWVSRSSISCALLRVGRAHYLFVRPILYLG